MKKIILKSLTILSVTLLLVFLLSSVGMAAEEMPGMDHEGAADEAAAAPPEPGSPGYTPIEEPADDSSMAAIAVSIFSVPVIGWFILRSVRKNKKKT